MCLIADSGQYRFSFRFKFYPPSDPAGLVDLGAPTRRLLFLQLRLDVSTGALPMSSREAQEMEEEAGSEASDSELRYILRATALELYGVDRHCVMVNARKRDFFQQPRKNEWCFFFFDRARTIPSTPSV